MPSSSRRGLLSDSKTARPSTGSSASSSNRKIKKQRHRQDESMSQLDEHSQTQQTQRYPLSDELPEYESPAFPLDAEARKALAELSANHDTRKFKSQMDSSYKQLSDSISNLNDALSTRKKKLREMQAKRQRNHENHEDDEGEDGEGGGGGGGSSNTKTPAERAEEKAVNFLKDEVPDLSEQIEAAVREVIDMQAMLEDGKEALHDAARQAETESAAIAQKQRERAAARQARQAAREAAREERMRAGDDGDEEEEQEEEEEDEDMQDEITGPLMMLQEAKHRMAVEYEGKSMYARYGVNNEYIAFKKLWHDATHGLEGKPLPDATRWFSRNGHDNDDDDDDDLVIDTETHALECPLSRQIMRDPYTSRTCKHTFDKESIKSFLAGTGRRPSDQPKQCPQLGCSEEVRFSDFYPDQIMLRRIKRAQEQDADMMDEDEGGYEDEPTMASVKMTQQRAIKTERGVRGRRTEEIDEDEEEEEE